MSHRIETAALFFFIAASAVRGYCAQDSTGKTGVAVFPCKIGPEVTVTEGVFITERITLELLKHGLYPVIDKYELSKRLGREPYDIRDTGTSPASYFELGAACSARYAVWGKLARNDSVMNISLCHGDVVDANVKNSVSTAIVGSAIELAEQIPALLIELLRLSVRVTTVPSSTKGVVSKTVYTPISPPRPAKLTVKSEPPESRVFINGEECGVTPYSKDSLVAGTYSLIVDRYGYIKFSKRIILKPGDDKRLLIRLGRSFGSLTVQSTPSGAKVSLSNRVTGCTPFTCDTMRPGKYTVRLFLDRYAPVSDTISLFREKKDTISATLLSLAHLDSLKQVRKNRNQSIRRIVLGAGAAVTLGIGIATDMSARRSLEDQRKAYDAYSNLTGANSTGEFSEAYSTYERHRKETDDLIARRNGFYIFGGVCLVGFGISIPF